MWGSGLRKFRAQGLRSFPKSLGFSGLTQLFPNQADCFAFLPIGPKVVPFGDSYLELYKVIPKRSYFGAYG